MTIFVDASALIAMIAGEDDADRLSDVLDLDGDRLCSAVSLWETVAGLRRSHALSAEAAREQARLYIESGSFRIVPLAEREYALAVDAFARYGKGRHSAALNMGDCFAYACAKANGAKLLYKGADFAQTDLS